MRQPIGFVCLATLRDRFGCSRPMALQGRLPLTCADYFGSARYCEHQQRSSEVTRIDNLVEILVHRGRNECAVDVMRGFEGAPWGGGGRPLRQRCNENGPSRPVFFCTYQKLTKGMCPCAALDLSPVPPVWPRMRRQQGDASRLQLCGLGPHRTRGNPCREQHSGRGYAVWARERKRAHEHALCGAAASRPRGASRVVAALMKQVSTEATALV